MKFHIPTQILRVSTFVILAAVIVLLFPQYNNSFRYHYEVGKPWGYATLRADFDFPIYKTDEQMAKEEKQLLSTFTPYYKYIPRVQREVMVISLDEMEWLQSEEYYRVAIPQRGGGYKNYSLSELYTPASAYKCYGYSIEQNLVRDTARTESMREKTLATLSPTIGMVQKNERIVEQGDIVNERTYQVLQSLQRAYKDENAGNKQKKLSLLGESILVVLFLSLFVIYLAVFRPNYARRT